MEPSSESDMKQRFYDRMTELISSKGQNSQIFTKAAYMEAIKKVKASKSMLRNKKPEDYQRLRRFDVLTIKDIEKLIVPLKGGTTIKYYTHLEEIFDILHAVHTAIGHGGRNRMEKELNSKYKNITREMIVTYLNLCKTCQKKQHTIPPPEALAVKPTLCREMNSRCQVDVIDMQSQADGQNKFILVYQDRLTKFIQLRPLKSKTPEEVACALLDIFTIFGAPNILQSDNGREFAISVVEELCKMWSELKIVHGKIRPTQSQGTVKKGNHNVENMLRTWMTDKNTTKWSEGLRFVQLMRNRAYHSDTGCSPFEAMFSTTLKVGLKSCIPEELLNNINTEEDLEDLLKNIDNKRCSEPNVPHSSLFWM